jgi:CHAT domain-containing protein
VQNCLLEGELILEFYETRGALYVFLISRNSVEAVELGPSASITLAVKLLKFQLGRYRWANEVAHTGEASRNAVSYHLKEIYRLLVRPVENRLQGFRHLIFAPYRDLHGLPFGALHDGERMLIDRFTLSAIPSGRVLVRCRQKKPSASGEIVVMAIPDPRAPRIEEEARGVAETLPHAKLLLGPDASLEAFRKYALAARVMHLSAHGVFRRDNPLFSALQLSDTWLNLMDLSRTKLNAELLTLSGCHTGSSVVVGGDELVGLMRGFLEAGARSLLVTLWDVDDAGTQDFMHFFYSQLRAGSTAEVAVQQATLKLRERFPHPYFWAPFLLVGDPKTVIAENLMSGNAGHYV